MTDLPLTKISETASTVTLGWTPVAGAVGYRFQANGGRWSHTWNPGRNQVKFGKPGPYKVQALGLDAEGVYPVVVPPPAGVVVAPPVGPFTIYDGNYAAASHAQAFRRGTDPYTLQKLDVREYTGYGIGSMQYYPPTVQLPARTLVEDCVAQDIMSAPPGSMDGKGEAGFWLGNPTDARRLVSRNNGWMGIWTGSRCSGSLIEDFEIDQSTRGIGLYVEHVTKDTVFRRFKIRSAGNGINIEWWYGGEGSSNLLFEDGDVYCPNPSNLDYRTAGVFADAGTFGCTFRRIRFWGPGNAIGLPNNLVDPTKPNLVEDCVFENLGRKVYFHDNKIG